MRITTCRITRPSADVFTLGFVPAAPTGALVGAQRPVKRGLDAMSNAKGCEKSAVDARSLASRARGTTESDGTPAIEGKSECVLGGRVCT